MQEQMVMFNFEYQNVIEVEETVASSGKAIIKGTMLREGVSGNDNVYEVPVMEEIAKQAAGSPVYYGTAIKFDFNKNMIRDGMHADFEPNRIGKIVSAIFDPIKRAIKYVAEIFNTPKFPHIVEEVKAGWGVSIKGIANAIRTLDASGKRQLMRIMKMVFESLQLVNPHATIGQNEARVEDVEIQETLIMETPFEIKNEEKPIESTNPIIKEPEEVPTQKRIIRRITFEQTL